MKILVNEIQCPECLGRVKSRHVHDFRYCQCEKSFVDGGREYVRCGGNLDQPPIQLTIYDDGTHKTRREHLEWGSCGKSGKEPLRYIKIKDLTDDHMDNIIKNVPIKGLVMETIVQEQKFRGVR